MSTITAACIQQAGVKHLVFSSLEDPRPGFTEDMPSIHNGSKLPGKMVKVNIEVSLMHLHRVSR